MAGETVLIVDDDRSFVDAVAVLLEESEYRVLRAYGGHEGLELARMDDVDLAVIDVNMPDMDGVELADTVAKMPKPISTILISSDSSSETADRCQAAGTGVFLAKPLDPECLLNSISRVLVQRS